MRFPDGRPPEKGPDPESRRGVSVKFIRSLVESIRTFWRWVATVVVTVAAVVLFTCSWFSHDGEPKEYGDGWHHLSQGSELFPYDFFPIIERADSEELFVNDLERYGLIPDAKDPEKNPLGLPVGLSVARHDGAPLRMIGMTCSACHSGQIEYQGRTRELIGAPGMFDPDLFFYDLADAAEATLKQRDKRFRFLKRYVGQETGIGKLVSVFTDHIEMERTGSFESEVLEDIDQLIEDEFEKTTAYLEESGRDARHVLLTGRVKDVPKAYQPADYSKTVKRDKEIQEAEKVKPAAPPSPEYDRPSLGVIGKELENIAADIRIFVASIHFLRNYAIVMGKATSAPGNGRVDAFGKVRNMVLPLMYGEEVIEPTTAPVSFPHLWGTRQTKWLHWNGNTDSVMQRNVLEALGSGAMVDLKKFDTTVNFENLYKLETMTHEFSPPAWPEDLLPEIDEAKAEKGERIFHGKDEFKGRFKKNCVECHPMATPYKKGELQDYRQYSLEDMKTDPNHAVNFNRPIAGGHGAFYANIQELAKNITNRYYTRFDISREKQLIWEDYREPVDWRSPIDAPLPARPLNGVWATAPFLHNGSVPTLYDLFLPPEDRPTTFTTGTYEFDPVKVGYETDAEDAPFVFDVNAAVKDADGNVYPDQPNGNSNGGHLFGTDLSEDERWALVEYLKTI